MDIADKRDLDVNELLLLQSEMRNHAKSLAIAYLMLLGGHLGVHRFYLKRYGTGAAQLALFLFAGGAYILTVILGAAFEASDEAVLGFILLFSGIPGLILTVWLTVDLFLMPKMVGEWNRQLEQQLIEQIIRLRHPL